MSEAITPKPNVTQLEALLDEAEGGEIEVRPDGSVVRLNVTELLEKNLRLERERNAALLATIKTMREVFKCIADMAKVEGRRFEV